MDVLLRTSLFFMYEPPIYYLKQKLENNIETAKYHSA